ncbi:MAG: O-antigen ligase family protein [Acidobacteria bacterium]|nr:O-antigen ligase family protein [Acidobacteriota bacterium]
MSLVEAGLILLVAIVPWGEGGATPGALAASHTVVFVVAAAAIVAGFRKGTTRVRLPWPVIASLPLAAVSTFSFLRAGYVFGSFETWWDLIVALILALALLASRPSARTGGAISAMVVASGVVQSVPAVATRLLGGVAVSPSFLNPNHLAAYLNVAALVALARGIGPGANQTTTDRRARWSWLAAGVVCVAGCLATGSRGALIALVATLLLAAEAAPGRLPLRRVLPVASIVAVLAVLSVTVRFATIFDPYRYDRPRIWAAVIDSWREAPILGLGPGMYAHLAARHNFPQEQATFRFAKEPHSAHSQPLQVLAEEGVAGLAALGLLVATTLACLRRQGMEPGERGVAGRAAYAPALAVLLQSVVETPFGAPAIPFTLLALSWTALAPADEGSSAAAFTFRWPRRDDGAAARMDRLRISTSIGVVAVVLYGVTVAAPYASYVAAEYAAGPERGPRAIEAAMRFSATANPLQPFVAYERARAAMGRARQISPPLLDRAHDAFSRAQDLAPGDPSAFALMGRLYARAVGDFPGAGPGAVEAAERHYGEAIGRSPYDARLLLERGGFRLATGRATAALEDALAALRLEPRALAARQLELEALLESGRGEEAAGSLRRLDEESARLRGYEPENGYEASLIRIDLRDLERARAMIAPSLFLLPGAPGVSGVHALRGGSAVLGGGPLGGGHHHDGGGWLLGENLIEEGGLGLRLAGRFPLPEAVPVHAGLADDGLNGLPRESLHRMIEVQLAARTVVVDDVAEAHGPLVHRGTPERPPI